MPRYEDLRDRLPSLYRPEADETAGDPLPLGRDDVAEVRGANAAIRFSTRPRGDALVVTLAEAGAPRLLRLTPGRAPGSGYALDVRAVDESGALSLKPLAVLAVVDGLAAVGDVALPSTFALELRRRSLLAQQLLAVASTLERLNREATDVMQSHWFRFADRAVYSPYFLRGLALQGLGLPAASDTSVRHFPYIDDLGRLASLLAQPPWQEPIVQEGASGALPETVETYRRRIARIVALYVNGLGTIESLRRMTEAQLPVDVDAPPERQDRPFGIEEFAPLETATLAVHFEGAPTDCVGPLMHWPIANDGLGPVAPTAYVQALTSSELEETAPDGEQRFRPADAPLLELYKGGPLRIGLAYRDTIQPGRTLRLRPAAFSVVALEGGAGVAGSDEIGPWQAPETGPGGPIAALLRTEENTVWAATGGELWRLDAGGWTKALDGLDPIHCLAEDGHDLLAGTGGGLVRIFRFPDNGFSAQPEPDPGGRTVFALLHAGDGTWWEGTSAGLGRLGEGDAFEATAFDVEVRALAEDSSGLVFAGGAAGLVAYRPADDEWWWYGGADASDEVSEWVSFDPADSSTAFPTEPNVFVPPVTAVRRTHDGTLWIGTETGLARYVARGDGGPVAFRTLLEAFPDLCPGRVDALVEDARGRLWACTDRGLLRFDGRDVFQYTGDAWVQLGRADTLYPAGDTRGTWRFRRAGDVWERFDATAATPAWAPFSGDVRTSEEPAVHALAFADSLSADLLDTWSPDDFSGSGGTPVAVERFVVRVKLDGDTRVVDGGIPALPRLPAGLSTWRYLSLEPESPELPVGRPAWTIEGRLLPADTPAPEPEPGRYDLGDADPFDEESEFDEAVFAYPPAARVGLAWEPRHPLSVLVRLGVRGADDAIDPAALDRVFAGMQQVRPAGVRAVLAVGAETVRKES
jgi:ligand-binding sensor domain-containing protein